MVRHVESISIEAPPEKVFEQIETMPNKFPVYSVLETKPVFFLRIMLVDGLRAAFKAVRYNNPDDFLILKLGDSMGPFSLSELAKPLKYGFTLDSFFFKCQTGYSLSPDNGATKLDFYLTAENPGFQEKVYWFCIKPMHGLLARKALKVIKKRVES